MSTTEQENRNENVDENNIKHSYFAQTPVKDWKISGALAYYIMQKVPANAAYYLVEVSLKNAMNSRKSGQKRGGDLLEELNVLKDIHEGKAPQPSSAESSNAAPSTVKIADRIDNFGNINQTNNISQSTKRKANSKSDDKKDGRIVIKKTRKSFAFSTPVTGKLLTINKPRITDKDASQIESTFEICISSTPSTPSSEIITREYEQNMKDQQQNKCLQSVPKAQNVLESLINGEYNDLLGTLFTLKTDSTYSLYEKQMVQLMQYIMVDFHANCEKPTYYTESNERTPYCEYVIPIFKYYSAVFKNISLMWCEKGLVANKQLAICLNDEQKKLMDGIGYSVKDKTERLIMECSGEIDGEHTEEDTLKLMEGTSRCLKNEMSKYLSASWETFGQRRVLAIQAINNTITLISTKRVDKNKWAFIEQRSALVPRDWEDRHYWVRVFELLIKLNELLVEQEALTDKLKREHVGLDKVDIEDTITYTLNK